MFLIHSLFTPLSHFVVFLNLLVSCLFVLLMVGRGSTEVKKSYVVIHTFFFLLFVVKLSPGFPTGGDTAGPPSLSMRGCHAMPSLRDSTALGTLHMLGVIPFMVPAFADTEVT